MNRRLRTVVLLVVFVLSVAVFAQAQTPAPGMGIKVDSSFVAAGKTLAKGAYAVDINAAGNVTLTAAEGGAVVELPALKKFSRNVQRVDMVFDIVGDMKFLSEVWVPGKGAVKVGSQPQSAERVTIHGDKVAK
jgi:hypothetical protein